MLLCAYDIREQRLPNWLTLPGALAVWTYGALLGQPRVAIVGGLLLAVIHLVPHLLSPSALGAGDVKLALGVGGAAALDGATAWLFAAAAAPALTAVVALATRQRRVPHGPSMCAATLCALVA